MAKVAEEVGIGAALIGASILLPGAGLAISASLLSTMTGILASAGAGFVLSGVGTLLGQKQNGIATTSRNPIAPWQVIYGRKKVGATVIYQEEVADNNRILLLVCAVACHSIDEIDEVWLNNKAINLEIDNRDADQMNPNGFWKSFDPPQGNWQIETIARVNDVVSVTFAQNPNSLFTNFDGQTLRIQFSRDAAGGNSFDGYFPVVQTGPASFSYTCGGPQGAGTGNPGTVTSTWPQYMSSVTVGYYTGAQTQASGIILGNTDGYWTADCIVKGRGYVAMKLQYDPTIFNGLPEISFVVRGKNDIFDPRTGQKGYTNNAALCIADFLAHPILGYNCQYGTQIPTADLIAAANICDEQVQLASGASESRYTCDGSFDTSVSRGEILQNLLTSCGGRLIEMGGQFIIQPAAWVSPSGEVTIGNGTTGPNMMMNDKGLVAEYYNNPAGVFVPDCAGTTQSQFVYALGLLNAFQAVGNPNAKALAQQIIAAIVPYLFRGLQPPSPVTATNPWSPDSWFCVKEPFLAFDGETISVTDDFASTIEGGWRVLAGQELMTSCDAYNWAMRLFLAAAAVFDDTTPSGAIDLGYGLSPYGASYGDPANPNAVQNSAFLKMLTAIQQMARIAYQMQFAVQVPGSTTIYKDPNYGGGMVPYAVDFAGAPKPSLNTWYGPVYVGFQSPWAMNQVNPSYVVPMVQFLAEAQGTLSAQGTGADTVVFIRTGANPATLSVAIEIAPDGTARAVLNYAGLNVGTDTIVGTLPSHSLTSNQAKIAWSSYAAPVAVFGVQIQVMVADGSTQFNGLSALLGAAVAVEGLMFNSHPFGLFPGDPHQSGNQANPFVSNAVSTTGNYEGDTPIPNTSGAFNAVITGKMTIETAGDYEFTAYVNSAFVFGCDGGASWVSGDQFFGALAGGTAQMKYPSLAGLNNAGDWPGGSNWAEVTFSIHFPNAGLYNFEIDYASGAFAERQFCLMWAGGVIPNVGIITGGGSATATGTAPSGQLQLTPYSGGYAIGQTASFVLELSGLAYTAPTEGPFAPVYQQPVAPGSQTWLPAQTFGFAGPDPNYTAGYYQYRPLAELCDLIAGATGTEVWYAGTYAQAVGVVNAFISWVVGKWTTAATGPPNYFPSTGAQTTAVDVHCAALLLYSVLVLDLAARPTGAGGPTAMDANGQQIIRLVYGLYSDTYLTSGPMAGTFCTDPTGNQDWSPTWSGEILRALSKLVTWGNLNVQPVTVAQAIVWIDGLVDFGLNGIVPVDPDLGYGISDLRPGPFVWKSKLEKQQLYNGVKGTYICASNQWQISDVPSYAQDQIHGYTNGTAAHNFDVNWDADGQRRWKDVQLPFTNSCAMAQRLLKIELMRIRLQGKGTLIGRLTLYDIIPLDTLYFSYAFFKWVNKVLEATNFRLTFEQSQDENPTTIIGTEVDVQEADPSTYEWDVSEELTAQGYSYLPGLQNLSPPG